MTRLLDIVFDVIALLVVVRMVAGAVRNFFGPGAANSSNQGSSAPSNDGRGVHGETVRDPVCGMFVSTELSHRLQSHGKLLHFCSEECLERYRRTAASA